jgi:Mg-chelatase subunit ChlD/lysophospholipase L1-like esterase
MRRMLAQMGLVALLVLVAAHGAGPATSQESPQDFSAPTTPAFPTLPEWAASLFMSTTTATPTTAPSTSTASTTSSTAAPAATTHTAGAGPGTSTTLAAAQSLATALAADPGVQTVLMVVDVSGSMAGSKLDQAKQALTTSVDALAPGQGAGLRSYAGSCGDRGRLLVPIAPDNRDNLRGAITSLTAGGGTPTPDALLGAATDLAPVQGPKAIILVSDGQSTCGNPCPTAQSIKDQQGIDFKVHTVGFQAPEAAEDELACIARVTGGQYVPATDADGLADAIGSAIGGTTYEYVAVGDSTTTGFSIPTCSENRATSPFGCVGTPPATPYPERVAAGGGPGVDGLNRKGIWGYTIREAVVDAERDRNELGPWEPQLDAAAKARNLVTVSIGANDMRFSDVGYWLGTCVGAKQKRFLGRTYDVDIVVKPTCEMAATARAQSPQLQAAMDAMFTILDAAKTSGAEVVITLQYNPYNESKQIRFLPDRTCKVLHTVADHITSALNTELSKRAKAHGFTIADFRPEFAGKGAGSSDSYVFGTDCETIGALTSVDFDLGWPTPTLDKGESKKEIQKRFDPHPNDKGTRAQADAVLEAIR